MKRRGATTAVAGKGGADQLRPGPSSPSTRPAGRSGWRRLLLFAVIGLALAALVSFNSWLKVAGLSQWQQDVFAVEADAQTVPHAPDALLVLGYCADHARREPTGPLMARVQLAVNLSCESLRSGDARGSPGYAAVVFSGGAAPRIPLGQATEADVMSETFSRLWQSEDSPCKALPQPRHILEHTSSSTLENARNTLAMLAREEPDIRRLHLVTNRFHQRRTLKTFEEQERRRQIALQQRKDEVEGIALAGDADGSGRTFRAPSDAELRPFEFTIARVPHDPHVPQLDFWREVAATVLYMARRWI